MKFVARTMPVGLLLSMAVISSVRADPITVGASDNATVQPAGPRTGGNGKSFLNIEGANNAAFASYGVLDFSGASFFIGGATSVTNLTLSLTESNAAFTRPGPVNVYLASNSSADIQPGTSPLFYDAATAPEGLGTSSFFGNLSSLGTINFATSGSTGNGTIDVLTLATLSATTSSFLAAQLTSGGTIRLVLTPATVDVAATWAGAFNANVGQHPTLSLTSNGTTTLRNLLWTGGNGTWDTTGARWQVSVPNDTVWSNASGSTTTASFNTSSTVTLNAGDITARNLEFRTGSNGISINGTSNVLTLASGAVSVATGVTATLAVQIAGTAGLQISGGGKLILANTNNSFSGVIIVDGSQLPVSDDAVLGSSSNSVTLRNGAVFTAQSALNNTRNFIFSGPGSATVDTGAFDMEFSGRIGGDGNFIKIGTGMLTLSSPDANPPGFRSGITDINAGGIRMTGADSNGFAALGSGGIRIHTGATVWVDNFDVGKLRNTGTNVGFVDIDSGGTLKATGTASYAGGRVSGVLNFNSTTSTYSTGSITILTTGAADVFTIKNAFGQFDPNNNTSSSYINTPANNITAHVVGGGRVELSDGGVSSKTTFGGSWSVDNGILQVGPFVANFAPSNGTSSSEWAGPFGQPLNALGFKTPNGLNGDPDLPNSVTINAGGMLVVAVDQVNTNPNISGSPVNSTPAYIRAPIVLNGGAIAASGKEVAFGASASDPQGVPSSDPVVARFGGNFTVSAGTSKVLVYDPVGGSGPRTVELVGGSRTIANASPGFAAGAIINYTTTWTGTLEIDPGGTTGGVFNINRTTIAPGTVSVTPGATIIIDPGATLDLNGAGVLSDGTNSVDVLNNSTSSFNVQTGTHFVGKVGGTGATTIIGGAKLSASSISQSSLGIGGSAVIRPNTSLANRTSILGALTIAGIPGNWTGLLDLNNNNLIIHAAGNVSNQIRQAASLGAWNGTGGITSSSAHAAATTSTATALAYASGAEFTAGNGRTSFDSQSILPTDTLVMYTLAGDANMDSSVTFADFLQLQNNYNQAGTNWEKGDWNYDGSTTFADFLILQNNYNKVLAPGNLGPASGAVPEPASLSLVLAASLLALRRRRRAS